MFPFLATKNLRAPRLKKDLEPSMQEIPSEKYAHLHSEIQNQNILLWNYKGLRTLPPSLVEEAPHIQHLYLKHNLLVNLPENLGKLKCLSVLYLYGNNIEELPESIGEIKTLNILNVCNNSLKHLTPSVTKLVNLKSLDISHNELSSIPSEISNLKSLSLFILSGNRICSLPESLGKLRGLQGLYVDDNVLYSLPHSLTKLPLLAHLSCSNNYLVNLPSKPFVSQVSLFFDNNPELNFLPFCLLHELRRGDDFDPYIIPSFGCFSKNLIKKRTVKVSSSKYFPDTIILNLPLQLKSITSYKGIHKLNIPPLLELCLRFLWKNIMKPNFAHIFNSGVIPKSLASYLDLGPIIYCENCQTDTVFIHVSIIVIAVKLTSQHDIESREVPIILYFCSDSCGHSFLEEVNSYTDNYNLWLKEVLACPLDVHFVSS